MSRPVILDLFCCAGGAAKGYHDAGFDVVGVDIDPQPNYPFEFIQADALRVLADCDLFRRFAAVHASPPCQGYSLTQKISGREHPMLIEPTRRLLVGVGLPYVIENVPGSPLVDPVELCGGMFGLGTYRHRLFESNVPLATPPHPEHATPTVKMGRRPEPGKMMHVVGNFSGVDCARRAMGIDWTTRRELAEAIPPAYTEHIGRQLIAHLDSLKVAA